MINDQQKLFFSENGYLKIPSAFSIDLMNQYIEKVETILSNDQYNNDILSINNQPQKLLYMFDKDESFVRLLVSDPILDIVRNLSDNYQEIVPTWEDLIIKKPMTKTGFKPHQDLPLQSINSNVFTTAIYLTNSHQTPLSFIPKSHTMGPLTKSELMQVCHKRKNDFVAVPANQGDIIIHNSKTIHKSMDNMTSQPKYTWYIEFRTLQALIHDSLWDNDWIMKRRAIFLYALQQYKPDLLDLWSNDYKDLSSYLAIIQLRVSHITKTVDFDMNSPYYHF